MGRFIIDGYGQIELNNVAFRRDGRIEAQCKLDNAFDTDKGPGRGNYAENGMLLAIDKTNNVVKFPAEEGEVLPIALHYSSEHMYDERTPGLKNFYLPRGTFLPRMGYLAVGDLFTTNCLGSDEFADIDEVFEYAKENDVWATTSAEGYIKLVKVAPATGTLLKIVKCYTMPNGTPGVKLQVFKA